MLAQMHLIRYTPGMVETGKRIVVKFYLSETGTEPVRDWLKALSNADRKIMGEDIKTVEFGWPVGMPTCRSLGKGLWEVRSHLTGNRIARVIFTTENGVMVLLHAFVRKSQTTPKQDLDLASKRKG